MYSRLLSTFCLGVMTVSTVLVAQGFDEDSIPEPTDFSGIVSDAVANISIVGNPRLIESAESSAKIAVVEVVLSSGTLLRGVRFGLKSDLQVANLYLDANQVAQFRDELAGFEKSYERGTTCEARSRCVHGVARCRPSQSERQAFCPTFYSTPDGKRGVAISTPRYSFGFPYIEPSILVDAIDAAIGELNVRNASEM